MRRYDAGHIWRATANDLFVQNRLFCQQQCPPPQYEHPYGTYQIYLKRFLSGGMPHHCTLYSQTSVQTIQQGVGGQHNRWYFAGNPAALPIGVPPADATVRCARQWSVGRSLDRSRRRGMDSNRRRYTTLTAAGMV